MKIKLSRASLFSAMQKLNSIIGSKSTLQIMSHVFMSASENKLTMITTDLDIRIKCDVEAEVIESGETTVPSKKLYEIVREMVAEEVYLESNENDHMTIKCGNSKFKLLGLPTEGFPVPVEASFIRSFTTSQNEFARMINLISYSVKVEDDGNR